MDRPKIKEVFLAHGFTVKEGQDDLKPYVYEAAEALLEAAKPPKLDPLDLAEAMLAFDKLARAYRGAVSVSAQALTYEALWGHVRALHEELALLRARALAVEAAQECVELHVGPSTPKGTKTFWLQVGDYARTPSGGTQQIPGKDWNALHYLNHVTPRGGMDLQLRRWCSPCQEYATTRCVGDPQECPLKFPKEG